MKSVKRVTTRRQCLVITRFFKALYDRLFPVYFPACAAFAALAAVRFFPYHTRMIRYAAAATIPMM